MRQGTYSLLIGALVTAGFFVGCKASAPNSTEGGLAQKAKELVIGGKDWNNPMADTAENQQKGAEHFRHHCQMVRYIRHLPSKGSLGAPKEFQESEHEHEAAEGDHALPEHHHL
jgi:hypothetical protein